MVNHHWDDINLTTACGDVIGRSVPFVSSTDWAGVSCPDCLRAGCHLSHPHDGDHAHDTEFVTHDSGERAEFPSGMRRDTDKNKPRYDLIPLPMLKRVAELYARGAEKYGDDNWTLADSEEEMKRFDASGFRHFVQLLMGERDEDHMAAVVFNVFARETVRDKLIASSDSE